MPELWRERQAGNDRRSRRLRGAFEHEAEGRSRPTLPPPALRWRVGGLRREADLPDREAERGGGGPVGDATGVADKIVGHPATELAEGAHAVLNIGIAPLCGGGGAVGLRA